MTDAELYQNPDHNVWAREFCAAAAKGFNPSKPSNIEWVASWFANAMMHGYDRAANGYPAASAGSSRDATGGGASVHTAISALTQARRDPLRFVPE